MRKDFLSEHHVIPLIAYSQDVTTGGATGMDAIALRDYDKVTFFVFAGSTNGDTSTVLIKATTSNATTGGTAMAFKYRTCAFAAAPATADTWGALTDATSAGVALTGTTYKGWAFEVTAEEAQAALANASHVYLCFTDGGTAMYGCAIAVLSGPRYPQAVPHTAIV